MTIQDKQRLIDELFSYCEKRGANVSMFSEGLTINTIDDVHIIGIEFDDDHFERVYKEMVELVNNKTK